MSDDIERKMEFIIEQQAKFEVDIAELKEVQRQQAVSIDTLTGNIAGLTGNIAELTVNVGDTREMLHLVITEMHDGFGEMRDGFDKLILANEVTPKLAEDVGRLAVATSQRVTRLESKLEGQP